MKVLVDSASLDAAQLDFVLETAGAIAALPGCDVTVLDRGAMPPDSPLASLPFPSYSPHRFNADDSILLQKMCDRMGADLFVSALTTPLSTPMLLVVDDGDSGRRLGTRPAMEMGLALVYAAAIFCDAVETADRVVKDHGAAQPKMMNDLAVLSTPNAIGRYLRHKPLAFYEDWARLRVLQSKTDSVLWDPPETSILKP